MMRWIQVRPRFASPVPGRYPVHGARTRPNCRRVGRRGGGVVDPCPHCRALDGGRRAGWAWGRRQGASPRRPPRRSGRYSSHRSTSSTPARRRRPRRGVRLGAPPGPEPPPRPPPPPPLPYSPTRLRAGGRAGRLRAGPESPGCAPPALPSQPLFLAQDSHKNRQCSHNIHLTNTRIRLSSRSFYAFLPHNALRF